MPLLSPSTLLQLVWKDQPPTRFLETGGPKKSVLTGDWTKVRPVILGFLSDDLLYIYIYVKQFHLSKNLLYYFIQHIFSYNYKLCLGYETQNIDLYSFYVKINQQSMVDCRSNKQASLDDSFRQRWLVFDMFEVYKFP